MKRWTNSEIELLKSSYPDKNLCLDNLREYSWIAIYKKAYKLGLEGDNGKWSEKEDFIIKENYSERNKNECLKNLPNRSWKSITARARLLGTKYVRNIHWTVEQDKFLQENYYHLSYTDLVKNLNKTEKAIQYRAKQVFKLERTDDFRREGSLEPLLSYNHEAMYWLGFLFADGHFKIKDGLLQVVVHSQDKQHLSKLASFINQNDVKDKTFYDKTKKKTRTHCSLEMGDKKRMAILAERYNISSRKTYSPINVDSLTIEQLLSLLIGFYDGDGTISKSRNGKIKCHFSWLDTFVKWKIKLSPLALNCNNESQPYKKDNYAIWFFSTKYLEMMKRHAVIHNLPIMDRKWSKVNNMEFTE